MTLALTYTRLQLVEMLRTPVQFLTIVLTPVAVMIFFLVPNLGHDAEAMTGATATMVVFATLLACVGQYSTTVAAMRESPWGAYLRTLPGGLAPQVVSNLVSGMVVVIAAVVPVVIVAALFTPATAAPARVAAAVAALLVAVVTFTMLGLAIGYTMSLRATVLANSLLLLALAVAGGMFSDPADTPALVGAVAPFVPTRGATDLVLAALVDHPLDPTALVMLALWTIALGVVTVWGHRRDEGRRFD
ncbi:MAG TPA: ABC transporter permease [Euzebyales bacterium]|nr:ABC transporter permease [Euzebyales bacterium]